MNPERSFATLFSLLLYNQVMRGSRLLIGAFAMGLAVPAILFFLLPLRTFSDYFTVAATCFLAWGLADLAANIVARPRRGRRSASQAVREWERHKELKK